MKKVLIVGGGIIGLSTAYYLQASGHKVTIIDKGDFSNNCSYGNAGYICPSHFIPMAAPGIVWQGIKWMLHANSPFYVKPALHWPLLDWGLKFARSATSKNVDRAALPLRDIALLSKEAYGTWSVQPDFEFGFVQNGLLEIFQTEKLAQHAPHIVAKGKTLGLDLDLLDYPALQALEPQTKIKGLGAIFFKCDAHLHPPQLMSTLMTYLKNKGVQFIANEMVTGFEKEHQRVKKVITQKNRYSTDELIIATGAWSRELAGILQTRIPMMPGRGYSFTLAAAPFQLNHPVILAEGRVALTPMGANSMRYGGTMELVSTRTPPRYQRVAGMVHSINQFFPEHQMQLPSTDQIWYGYRPCSADGLPYIGRIKNFKNVVIATGHSMLGISLGPGTGQLVAEIIDEKKSTIPMKAFAVERFG